MADVLKIYAEALAAYKAKNFGKALKLQGRVKKISPTFTKGWLLEAYIRREQNFFTEEISVLEKFLPKINLAVPTEKSLAATGFSLLGSAYRNLGESTKAVNAFLKSAELEVEREKICTELSNAIFSANDGENFTAEDFKKLYALYEKNISDIKPYPKKFYGHKKIRIGYLSADFHAHPVANFIWALIAGHNRNFFKVYCYSAGETSDFVTKKIRDTADEWRDISNLPDEATAQLIRADEIDILFDLSGHTSGNRLLAAAYRPAPVQISGIGYMNSTGLSCFDYFLSDKFCSGGAAENYFTEKIICLPNSHFCYTPQKIFPETGDAPCLANGFVTFGCFNNFSKVTDSVLRAWKKILDSVPRSRLILKHKIFDNADGKSFVQTRLKNFDFDLSRVEMRKFSADYLAEYRELDIALDTFPYTGGITTCEALFMGVPVVSVFGERHGTRFGLSLLANVGVEELAVKNFDEYVTRAVSLAEDFELLSILHKNLRRMMKNSHLMNVREYVQAVEKKFFEILK